MGKSTMVARLIEEFVGNLETEAYEARTGSDHDHFSDFSVKLFARDLLGYEDVKPLVKHYPNFLRRDVLCEDALIIVEDLPRLYTRRHIQILRELLTQTRHYRDYVICVSQTDLGLDKRFIRMFKWVVLFKMILDYQKWRKVLSAGEARFLKGKVDSLEPHRCIMLDLESGSLINSFENRETSFWVRAMHRPVDAVEAERLRDLVEKQKSETHPRCNNNGLSKAALIREMAIEMFQRDGKIDRCEIVRATNGTMNQVRVVLSDLRAQGIPIPRLRGNSS